MSTRANIIITDGYQNQIFYRHSDGYPAGVTPTLQKFVDWVADGKVRNNTGQAAGWLIMLGALEYQTVPEMKTGAAKYDLDFNDEMMSWKVGAYEPTDNIHGDIDYLYLIDLRTPSVKMIEVNSDVWKKGRISLEKSVKDFYSNTRLAVSGDAALYDFIKEVKTVEMNINRFLNPEFVKGFKGKVIIKPTSSTKKADKIVKSIKAKHTIIVRQK
jgi:hypothetical protein